MEKQYDIAVVGGGGAGFCAAMRAAQLGMRVALLEKAPSVGGSAAMARGIGAVGARDQKDKAAFSVSDMLTDWMEQTNYLADYPLIYTYLANSGETVDWLQDLGCRLDFVGSVQKKHENDPFQTYFIWDTYKAGEMRRLISLVEEKGGTVMTRTAGRELITENGRVTGVWAERDGERFPVRARAVILCTGGYGANEEMVLRATRGVKVNPINTGCQTGDGINMGIAAGADVENLDAIEFHGCDSPCDKVSRSSIGGHGNELSTLNGLSAALWVNRSGFRFVNECVCDDISYTGNITFRQGSEYFVLFDQRMADRLADEGAQALGYGENVRLMPPDKPWMKLKEQIEAGLESRIAYRADSPEELALAAGIDPENLKATLERYNRDCHAGCDGMYGKDAVRMIPIETPPYYITEGRANQLCSLGGLRIDPSMRVMGTDRRPVRGLYAAGCDAAGGLVNNAYVSYEGVTLGWACTSGRLAAENAVKETEELQ